MLIEFLFSALLLNKSQGLTRDVYLWIIVKIGKLNFTQYRALFNPDTGMVFPNTETLKMKVYRYR